MTVYRVLAFFAVAIGSALSAVGTNVLVIPNHLAGGGVGGALTIVKYLYGTPLGLPLFLLNLPFLFWLYRLSGWHSVLKTLVSAITFSVVVDATAGWTIYAPTHDRWLASVWAGLLFGISNWIILWAGGSSGGTSLIGKILRITKGWEIQTFLLVTDAVVMVTAGVVMKDIQMTMYSVVMAFFVAYTLDSLTRMLMSKKKVTIHSEQADEIAQLIIGNIRRGVTLIQGMGGFTGRPRQIIECVMSHSEARAAIELVRAIDPTALIDVVEVSEAHGPGFDLPTVRRPLSVWKQGTPP